MNIEKKKRRKKDRRKRKEIPGTSAKELLIF
jgi:hypothetical protein